MDLRQNKITVQELLNNPKSRAVLNRRFPKVFHMPIMASAGSLTLEQAMSLASAYVPKRVLQEAVKELEAL